MYVEILFVMLNVKFPPVFIWESLNLSITNLYTTCCFLQMKAFREFCHQWVKTCPLCDIFLSSLLFVCVWNTSRGCSRDLFFHSPDRYGTRHRKNLISLHTEKWRIPLPYLAVCGAKGSEHFKAICSLPSRMMQSYRAAVWNRMYKNPSSMCPLVRAFSFLLIKEALSELNVLV